MRIENILMNVFGGRFSTPEYAAYFCSYQMHTIVVELRDTLLNSSDNFGSILRGALVNFRPFSLCLVNVYSSFELHNSSTQEVSELLIKAESSLSERENNARKRSMEL